MEDRSHATRRRTGRPLSFNRAVALHEAMLAFWRHGYETTSIAELTAAMGITAPSLYAAFGDKERLFLEAMRLYAGDPADMASGIADAVTAHEAARQLMLNAVFTYTGEGTPKGCLLASATASGSSTSAGVQEAVAGVRLTIAQLLQARIERDIAAGVLPPGTGAAALAGLVLAVTQGMSVLARDGATRAALLTIVEAALQAWPGTDDPAKIRHATVLRTKPRGASWGGMQYVALATDYDGTIAHDGVVDEPTIAALERLRESGRKLILVTGRELDDLIRVLPQIGLFDRVVAENGALIYYPETKQERVLAAPPPPTFVEALRKAGVSPLSVGRSIVATWEPNEVHVLEAIRDLGLSLQITFNKGAVMVLPEGVNKESGLRAALEDLDVSPLNTVAVGDAENDFAFFSLCGMPVAVQNALPMLKNAAVWVTEGVRGAGVAELIDRLIETDLAEFDLGNARQTIQLAEGLQAGEQSLLYAPTRGAVLLAGSSGGGKTTLVVGVLERLAKAGFQALVIDPEGDYDGFEGCISLGTPQDAPTIAVVLDVLRKSSSGVSVNLLGIKLEDRPAFLGELMPGLTALRAETGRPHLFVVDEAHHLLPCSDAVPDPLPPSLDGILFVTVRPDALPVRTVKRVSRVLTVGDEAPEAIRHFCEVAGLPPSDATEPVPRGELLTVAAGEPMRRMKVIPGASVLKRHLRKYAEGNLGDDRAFFFRGPAGALNLRAGNIITFLQLSEGVDSGTWDFHRRAGDYSRWIGLSVKDGSLAEEVGQIEQGPLPDREARDAVRQAIERVYTLPA